MNYRDLIIPKVCVPNEATSIGFGYLSVSKQGKYPFGTKDGIVPASDGAGVVEAVGSRVTRFKTGDKVLTLFNQGHLAGAITQAISATGVGGSVDGALRQYGAFSEQGLVAMPESLDFAQASALPCAALTAWNSLYGLESKALKPGDTVLTQGTGGVSIFALQVNRSWDCPFGAYMLILVFSSPKLPVLELLQPRAPIQKRKSSRSLVPTMS